MSGFFFFFQAEDGIRDAQESRGLGDVYKRQDQAQDAVSAAHDPEELEAAQRELDKVVHLIQNGTNVYFDDLSQLTKQEVRTYHGDIDGSKLFGDYPLHPNQTILVAPPYREPPEVPPRRITMWFNGKKDNVGAAFVKVRTSEKNQLPAFVPEPCWTGEELVCLLYTSDAADEEDSVDLGGRRIIKKKKKGKEKNQEDYKKDKKNRKIYEYVSH
eukprot:TRINITY_DN18910_c0_g1_i1.p1 TRINITY_DN18910_c0_g1~~TRINITY_DN18910_c0_g1_i1.p1  ORF type:complete len:214 (+),score=62.97 TRINITY_DN18910_c0_g1_i1:67-708(+)